MGAGASCPSEPGKEGQVALDLFSGQGGEYEPPTKGHLAKLRSLRPNYGGRLPFPFDADDVMKGWLPNTAGNPAMDVLCAQYRTDGSGQMIGGALKFSEFNCNVTRVAPQNGLEAIRAINSEFGVADARVGFSVHGDPKTDWRTGPCRLIKVSYIKKLAASGGVIQRRQDLPEEAFVDEPTFMPADRAKGQWIPTSRQVYAVSYPWLTPEHPDPAGFHLKNLAKFLTDSHAPDGSPPQGQWAQDLGDGQVFWDFASLYQHAPNGGPKRTDAEQESFYEGLNLMTHIYANISCKVVQCKATPPGWAGAPYDMRGWCFFEDSIAGMTTQAHNDKAANNKVDLSNAQNSSKRPPVLNPERFAEELAKRHFTNGKSDCDLVAGLYRDVFFKIAPIQEMLGAQGAGWGPAELDETLKTAQAYFFNLRYVDLAGNPIGDQGADLLIACFSEQFFGEASVLVGLALDDCGISAAKAGQIRQLWEQAKKPVAGGNNPRGLSIMPHFGCRL